MFPESEPQKTKKPEVLPIVDPTRCSGNQLYFPAEPEPFCDCGAAHLYHPPTDDCYPAYLQGPCRKGQHLILKKNKSTAECDTNPCSEGYVKFEGSCEKLEAPEPCGSVSSGDGVLNINPTTLKPECEKGTEILSLFRVPPNCPPGSKRDSANRCRENFNV